MLTEKDFKLTGKQLFEGGRKIIDEIQVGEDEDDEEEFKDDEEDDGAEDEDDGTYDKALYNVEDLEDEDVDFE